MSRFTVRVELLDTVPQERCYDILHQEMSDRGLTKTITNEEQTLLHLPDGEYNMDSDTDMTSDDVLQLVREAAIETGKDHRILITPTERRTFWNLLPVND